MAHHFGAVSVVALPANLVALPAVAPVMWIGMLAAAARTARLAAGRAADLARRAARRLHLPRSRAGSRLRRGREVELGLDRARRRLRGARRRLGARAALDRRVGAASRPATWAGAARPGSRRRLLAIGAAGLILAALAIAATRQRGAGEPGGVRSACG